MSTIRNVVWNGMNTTLDQAQQLNEVLGGEVIRASDKWYLIIGDEKVAKRQAVMLEMANGKITESEWKIKMIGLL